MQKHELIDFGGQNETDEYNRISFLVLLWLTFEKTTDNTLKIKAKNSRKNQSENKKSNYFSPREGILLRPKRRKIKLQVKKTKKTSQLFWD